MTPNELIVAGFRMGMQLLHRLVDDLTEEEFHHQPLPGSNSAAWNVGHLAIVSRSMAESLGATNLPVLSEEFLGRFNVTGKAAGTQSSLGSKAEILGLFDSCTQKLIEAARTAPPAALLGPPPSTIPFATNSGEAILFGAMHITLHAGQLSTIRRSLGKPPLV